MEQTSERSGGMRIGEWLFEGFCWCMDNAALLSMILAGLGLFSIVVANVHRAETTYRERLNAPPQAVGEIAPGCTIYEKVVPGATCRFVQCTGQEVMAATKTFTCVESSSLW